MVWRKLLMVHLVKPMAVDPVAFDAPNVHAIMTQIAYGAAKASFSTKILTAILACELVLWDSTRRRRAGTRYPAVRILPVPFFVSTRSGAHSSSCHQAPISPGPDNGCKVPITSAKVDPCLL